MKKKAIQKFLLEFFLSSFAGILLTLPFPKFGLTQVAWVSFIPLFLALEGARSGKAFFLGWITGIVHFSTLLSWVTVSMNHYGNLSETTSFFSFNTAFFISRALCGGLWGAPKFFSEPLLY